MLAFISTVVSRKDASLISNSPVQNFDVMAEAKAKVKEIMDLNLGKHYVIDIREPERLIITHIENDLEMRCDGFFGSIADIKMLNLYLFKYVSDRRKKAGDGSDRAWPPEPSLN